MPIKFTSLNVQGLNSPFKCSSPTRKARSLNTDILIQEMHFATSKTPTIILKHFPHIFTASNPRKKKTGFSQLFWTQPTSNYNLNLQIPQVATTS